MEKKLVFRGAQVVVALLVIVGLGLYFFGFDRFFGASYVLQGLELDKAEGVVFPEIQYHYQQAWLQPLQASVMADLNGGRKDNSQAGELVALSRTINSLQIDQIVRDRLDNFTVTYSMNPAPPDGITERVYRIDTSGTQWRVMFEETP